MRYFNSFQPSRFLSVRILRADLRIVAMIAAIFIYAILGSPTPDALSWVEALVGAFLLLVIGIDGIARVLRFVDFRDIWFQAGQIFMVYGLAVGLLGAVISGVQIGAIMRDVLPFGFLFLPLFFIGFYQRGRFERIYMVCFITLGLVFSVRAASPALGFPILVGYEALYYLGNSPAVLFAALFLFGCGVRILSRGINVRNLSFAVLCFTGCVVAVLPIIMTVQRASMAAIVVYMGLAFGILLMRNPKRMVVIGLVIGGLAALIFGDVIDHAYQTISLKSELVGANMRYEEWAAVWGEISSHPLTLLFGQGWGASFSSPAVADIDVSYTHSLLSSMLLKVGLVGFVLCAGYIGALFYTLLRHFRGREIIVMAIVAPLLIDVFLYAAYKSLDFGLLLGLIPMVICRNFEATGIASKRCVMYEKGKGANHHYYA